MRQQYALPPKGTTVAGPGPEPGVDYTLAVVLVIESRSLSIVNKIIASVFVNRRATTLAIALSLVVAAHTVRELALTGLMARAMAKMATRAIVDTIEAFFPMRERERILWREF
ncbi:hypothetical protein AMTR_s00140p00094780 [Amborella trichopoda]|uniref:Uncharacterized protein n=1 Tax=Amborella trichopoda TaxID=13333 RepID=W1PAT1_AMBTC|nr:hypothetical protein AMTR_s00140p00094780 [Amborella trichopoda]